MMEISSTATPALHASTRVSVCRSIRNRPAPGAIAFRTRLIFEFSVSTAAPMCHANIGLAHRAQSDRRRAHILLDAMHCKMERSHESHDLPRTWWTVRSADIGADLG